MPLRGNSTPLFSRIPRFLFFKPSRRPLSLRGRAIDPIVAIVGRVIGRARSSILLANILVV